MDEPDFGPEHSIDILQENEELKVENSFFFGQEKTFFLISLCFLSMQEEIAKLAGQIQFLKIVGMISENRHLKAKKDGYFTKENCIKQLQLTQYCRVGSINNSIAEEDMTNQPLKRFAH